MAATSPANQVTLQTMVIRDMVDIDFHYSSAKLVRAPKGGTTVGVTDGRAMPAQFELRRFGGGIGTVCLGISGEIDISNSEELSTPLTAVLDEPGVTCLILDLAALTFVDSTGVGVLIACRRAAEERGVRFGVVNPRGFVRRVLQVLGVAERLAHTVDPPV